MRARAASLSSTAAPRRGRALAWSPGSAEPRGRGDGAGLGTRPGWRGLRLRRPGQTQAGMPCFASP
eukprot:3477262-Alexandrium_andersonii.AAC.1